MRIGFRIPRITFEFRELLQEYPDLSEIREWLMFPESGHLSPDFQMVRSGMCLREILSLLLSRGLWPKMSKSNSFEHFAGNREINKPNEIWRDTSTFGSQPSPGCVPFGPWKCPVPQTFCPIYVALYKSVRNIPDVLGTRPQTVSGTLSRQIEHQIPLCVLC